MITQPKGVALLMRHGVAIGTALMLAGCAAPQRLSPGTVMGEQRPMAARSGNSPDIYANVCHLRTTRTGIGGDGGRGSAVLYRGQYLITAAHNVYSPFYNRVARISVYCGIRDVRGATPDFVLTNGEWATARGYNWRRYGRDLGVIRLPRPIATDIPVLLAENAPDAGTIVELAGYPGEGIGTEASVMFAGTGAVAASAPAGRIGYAIHTTTGNSGGPVWARDGQSIRLVGIHVVGYGAAGGGARRVDDWFRNETDRMIAALDRAAAARGP